MKTVLNWYRCTILGNVGMMDKPWTKERTKRINMRYNVEERNGKLYLHKKTYGLNQAILRRNIYLYGMALTLIKPMNGNLNIFKPKSKDRIKAIRQLEHNRPILSSQQ